MYNSVALTNPVIVQSVNGPDATIIQPYPWQGRCAYVGNNAILAGFTLTGGHAARVEIPTKSKAAVAYGASRVEWSATAWLPEIRPTFTAVELIRALLQLRVHKQFPQIFRRNRPQGGGVFGGTLYNCTIISNLATIANAAGGGASQSTLYNCILTGNLAKYNNTACNGGGANLSTLYNCTVSGNTAIVTEAVQIRVLFMAAHWLAIQPLSVVAATPIHFGTAF